MLDMGWRPSPSEVARVAAEMLTILAYIHQHKVTVIHHVLRDMAGAAAVCLTQDEVCDDQYSV